MKKAVLLFLIAFSMVACHKHHDEPEPVKDSEFTILMYMPWSKSGSNDNIYSCFLKNISGMKTAIEYERGLGNRRFLVLIATNESRAYLIDIKYKNGACVNDTIKTYTGLTGGNYTSVSGLTSFFNDVKAEAPASSYALIIGSHACGWIPAGQRVGAKRYVSLARGTKAEEENLPLIETRWFGNPSSETYQTNISTLAAAIRNSFQHTEYILFDDCYMSNIEVAYELKDVSDYLIASTCEVMLAGMPYATIGSSLMKKDYNGIAEGFYNFYKDYVNDQGVPRNYGTIGVTKLSEVGETVNLMKQINNQFSFDGNIDEIQRLDGYTPTIFFDMGDYVKTLCKDATLYAAFENQMKKMVPYKRCTDEFFSQPSLWERYTIPIDAFSGITISDPSINSSATNHLKTTGWWEATH